MHDPFLTFPSVKSRTTTVTGDRDADASEDNSAICSVCVDCVTEGLIGGMIAGASDDENIELFFGLEDAADDGVNERYKDGASDCSPRIDSEAFS